MKYRDWDDPSADVQRDTPTPVISGQWSVWIQSAKELTERLRNDRQLWRIADKSVLFEAAFRSWRHAPPNDEERTKTIADYLAFYRAASERLAGS